MRAQAYPSRRRARPVTLRLPAILFALALAGSTFAFAPQTAAPASVAGAGARAKAAAGAPSGGPIEAQAWAEPPVPFVIHTVKPGETLEDVAARYGVSVEAVARNNGLAADATLNYADGLFVPIVDGLLYTVLEPDLSADALASRLGLDAAEFAPVAGDHWGLLPGRTILIRLSPARLASIGPKLDSESRLDSAALGRIAAAETRGTQLTLREGGLSWPAAGRLAQLFWTGHQGVDIAAPGGSPIWAPADGVVSFEGWTPFGGIAICTKHAGGLESCSYHAAATFVNTGDSVRRGDPIGAVGMSGLAAGPHVHWELKRDGVIVDPLVY
ncbi:MAG TPA: M23 family metallopeptidase [Candidatus Limnocylindria bacterium]